MANSGPGEPRRRLQGAALVVALMLSSGACVTTVELADPSQTPTRVPTESSRPSPSTSSASVREIDAASLEFPEVTRAWFRHDPASGRAAVFVELPGSAEQVVSWRLAALATSLELVDLGVTAEGRLVAADRAPLVVPVLVPPARVGFVAGEFDIPAREAATVDGVLVTGLQRDSARPLSALSFEDTEWTRGADGRVTVTGTASGSVVSALPLYGAILFDSDDRPLGAMVDALDLGTSRAREIEGLPFSLSGDVMPGEVIAVEMFGN